MLALQAAHAKQVNVEATYDSDEVHVALRDEDAKEGHCARLRKWLRGMR